MMMHQGQTVMDLAGEDKKAASVDTLLAKFNEISVECGN
jgi:putative ABC transport system ATP-binding protein